VQTHCRYRLFNLVIIRHGMGSNDPNWQCVFGDKPSTLSKNGYYVFNVHHKKAVTAFKVHGHCPLGVK